MHTNCPYCGASQKVFSGDIDYSEDMNNEHECCECGKNFIINVRISYRLESRKADCLNGAPHDMEVRITTSRAGRGRSVRKLACKVCDYETWQPVDKPES